MDEVDVRPVFEEYPLYRAVRFQAGAVYFSTPGEVRVTCQKCGSKQRWKKIDEGWPKANHSFGWNYYVCKNCETEALFITHKQLTRGSEVLFFKIGQYPTLYEAPPANLDLGDENGDRYSKALRCRAFNFGLAALAYLRRVVEDRMDSLLDLIGEAARETGQADDALLGSIHSAKTSRSFDEKVELASGIIPAHLKPGGRDPLDALHDISSEGIHRLDEDECIDRFDRAREAFEYVFGRLQVEKADAARYVQAIRELDRKRSERGKKAEPSVGPAPPTGQR